MSNKDKHMDMLQIGAKLLSDKLGLSVDTATIQSALSGLLGDGQGGIDLGAIAAKMASSGELSSVVSSWLGDGASSGGGLLEAAGGLGGIMGAAKSFLS
ncbi:MAG: hypothetical protein ACJAYC_001673 [Halieaceae bacterium]|jgi:hypothetical protein